MSESHDNNIHLDPEQMQIAKSAFELLLRSNGQEITPMLAGKLAFQLAGIEKNYESLDLTPAMIGLAEIAELTGKSKQRIFQQSRNDDFPEPIARLSMGPIWSGTEIANYYNLRGSTQEEPSKEEGASAQPRFLLSEITSAKDILVREHFTDFGKSHDVPNSTYTRAFHMLLDQRKANSQNQHLYKSGFNPETRQHWTQTREPNPIPGIVIVTREEAGIEPYAGTIVDTDTQILAGYGIEAGSVLEVFGSNANENATSKTLQAIGALASQLRSQIIH